VRIRFVAIGGDNHTARHQRSQSINRLKVTGSTLLLLRFLTGKEIVDPTYTGASIDPSGRTPGTFTSGTDDAVDRRATKAHSGGAASTRFRYFAKKRGMATIVMIAIAALKQRRLFSRRRCCGGGRRASFAAWRVLVGRHAG